MKNQTFSLLSRSREMADGVNEIMGLPDDRWSDIEVRFGMETFGTATITFLLTAEQMVALAKLSAHPMDGDDCA